MQLEKYVNEFRTRLEAYFVEKKPAPSPDRCCIMLSPHEITLILIKRSKETNEIKITLSEILKYEDIDSLELVLTGLIARYEIELVPTYWLLSQLRVFRWCASYPLAIEPNLYCQMV